MIECAMPLVALDTWMMCHTQMARSQFVAMKETSACPMVSSLINAHTASCCPKDSAQIKTDELAVVHLVAIVYLRRP